MLPDNYGIHEKTVKKAYGSYDVVIGRFLCFAYTVIYAAHTRQISAMLDLGILLQLSAM